MSLRLTLLLCTDNLNCSAMLGAPVFVIDIIVKICVELSSGENPDIFISITPINWGLVSPSSLFESISVCFFWSFQTRKDALRTKKNTKMRRYHNLGMAHP